MQMDLDVLFTDHELDIYSLYSWQSSAIKELLGHEFDTNLELKALELDISMAFGLDEAFLKLKVATVESGSEVVRLKDYGVVFNIIVEVDDLVGLRELEGILNQVPLVALELNIGDLHIVDKAYYLVKYDLFSKTQCAKI